MEQAFFLTEDMLWDYADGFLSPTEKAQVESYLLQHPEHQTRLDAIMAEKRLFSAMPLERPETGFADRTMAAWVAEQSLSRGLSGSKGKDWILYGIAAAMGLFLILPMLLFALTAPAVSTEVIPEYIPQMPAIPWEQLLTSPILRMGLPLTLLFFSFRFLDQYLHQKKMLAGLNVQ